MSLLASNLVEVERKVISTKDSPRGKLQAQVGHFFFCNDISRHFSGNRRKLTGSSMRKTTIASDGTSRFI